LWKHNAIRSLSKLNRKYLRVGPIKELGGVLEGEEKPEKSKYGSWHKNRLVQLGWGEYGVGTHRNIEGNLMGLIIKIIFILNLIT